MKFKILAIVFLCSSNALAFNPIGKDDFKNFQYRIGVNQSNHFSFESMPKFAMHHVSKNIANVALDASIAYHLTANSDIKLAYDLQNNLSISSLNSIDADLHWNNNSPKFSYIFYNPTGFLGLEIGARHIFKRKVEADSEFYDLEISGNSFIIGFEKNSARYYQDKFTLLTSVGYEHAFMKIQGAYISNEYLQHFQIGKVFLTFSLAGGI